MAGCSKCGRSVPPGSALNMCKRCTSKQPASSAPPTASTPSAPAQAAPAPVAPAAKTAPAAPTASKPVSRSPAADLAAELAELSGAPAQPAEPPQPGAIKPRRSPSRGKNRSPRGAAPGTPVGAEDQIRRGGIAKPPAAAPAAKPAAAKPAAAKPAAAKPACLAGAAPVAPAAASMSQVAATRQPRTPAMPGTVRAPPVSSNRTFSCPDCGELFPSFPAQLLHQLASEPAHAPLAAEPTPVAAPAAPAAGAGAMDGIAAAIAAAVTAAMTHGGVGAAGAAGAPAPAPVSAAALAGAGAVEHFAPKHGVRLLRNALDLAMVLPLLYAEPVVALDLEGDLTPGATQGVDLMQLYLPSVDLAPQHGPKWPPSLCPRLARSCTDAPDAQMYAATHRSTHRSRGPRACSGRSSGPERSALVAWLAAPKACAPVSAHRRRSHHLCPCRRFSCTRRAWKPTESRGCWVRGSPRPPTTRSCATAGPTPRLSRWSTA
jgi:hypothetical protein